MTDGATLVVTVPIDLLRILFVLLGIVFIISIILSIKFIGKKNKRITEIEAKIKEKDKTIDNNRINRGLPRNKNLHIKAAIVAGMIAG